MRVDEPRQEITTLPVNHCRGGRRQRAFGQNSSDTSTLDQNPARHGRSAVTVQNVHMIDEDTANGGLTASGATEEEHHKRRR
jgi:hypothetical protein